MSKYYRYLQVKMFNDCQPNIISNWSEKIIFSFIICIVWLSFILLFIFILKIVTTTISTMNYLNYAFKIILLVTCWKTIKI